MTWRAVDATFSRGSERTRQSRTLPRLSAAPRRFDMNAFTRLWSIPLASLMTMGCANLAEAQPRHFPARGGVYDFAPVVDVVPVLRTVRVEQPRRECWHETSYETVHYRGRNDRGRTAVPTIAGGVVGGVIGNQFGSGGGRDAMTLLGTLVGAAVAAEHAQNRTSASGYRGHPAYQETRPVTVERCAVRTEFYEEQRLEGYDVTYLYAGREFRTRTATPPGDRIQVRVDVQPAVR
jgi:uncharacterized protein YcfJ